MKSFSDFWDGTQAPKNEEMYALITSPLQIGYFLTINTDYDLFQDEVKVLASDNKINIDQVNIKRLFSKFNKQYA